MFRLCICTAANAGTYAHMTSSCIFLRVCLYECEVGHARARDDVLVGK